MPDRTDLHGDEVVELVAPVRGGGQAKPAPDRDLLDGVLEGGRWHVVALSGDDQAVSGGEISDIVPAGQGLQCDHVDGAAQFGPACAELPALTPRNSAIRSATGRRGLSGRLGPALDAWCAAMTAHAITVLPDPGGATSIPRSCRASSVTAAHCGGVRVAVKTNCCAVPGVRSSVMSRRLPACVVRSVTVPSMPRGRIRPPSRVSS